MDGLALIAIALLVFGWVWYVFGNGKDIINNQLE